MPFDSLIAGLARVPLTWGLDGLALLLLICYQLYLSRVFHRQPQRTHRGRSDRLRRAWVETIRAGGKDILAVQTLRNWVMSATLFASTCVLLGLGFIGVAFRELDLADLSQALSWAPTGAGLVRAKLLLLAAIFFSGFMHFVLALRYYNHTGFLINLPADYFNGLAVDPVAATLNRAGGHYNRGTRVFLLAIPFILWLIGPDWFLGGVTIALVLLYRFDLQDDPDLIQAAMTAPTRANTAEGVTAAHALPAAEVITALKSHADGLSTAEAAKRLAAVGPNRLPTPPQDGPLKRFLRQFNDSLIYVLLGGAVVTALMEHWVDTWVIVAVTVINALIGFIQEGKAEQALAGIRKMLAARAHCRRDGQWLEVDAADLVPGDCVRLRPGDRVPADLRLLKAASLRIDESALTGESVPADKDSEAVEAAAGIGDRHGMAYAGTLVAGGTGLGVVTGTGATTELGRINRLIAEVEPLATPLTRQMAAFGRVLSLVILAMAVGMFLIGWQLHDFPVGELVMAAIGFAVAAIPEGLPAVLTITLALGVQQMARRNAITRRLPAVETLGSVTVICTDKTGTLTRNEMTAREVVTRAGQYAAAGIGYAPDGEVTRDGSRVELAQAADLKDLIAVMARCNDAEIVQKDGHWQLVGEPTEGALRTLARKLGFSRGDAKRLAVIPFDSQHKFMATLQEVPGAGVQRLMKGAPGALLERCTTQRAADGRDEPLDRDFWVGQIDTLSAQGLRVLAAAVGTAPPGQTELDPADLTGLKFLGLVGIVDPPRPEAIVAIAAFRAAGIRVKMITGDHAGTAGAIGREMGITADERAVTGAELEAASDEELRRIVGEYDVFARTSPEHKLRLVQALQANGEVVAMTGDGVNDAPALKRADVGVAMGIKGTEATKEAAAIVLTDDNFATIERAVEQGRAIYDNLQKSILFLLPTNGAQALVILVAVVFGFTLPLTPVQILWVNMVVAVTLALALAFEPAEPGVMQRPPRRPDAPILGGWFVSRIVLVSLLIGAATIAVFLYEQGQGQRLAAAQTMAVNTLVLGQVFFLINCRFLYASSLNPRRWFTNPVAWVTVAVLMTLQLLFVYVPFMNRWFHTTPVTAHDWLLPLGVGVGVFLVVELEKALLRWFKRA
ncbi:HAD-IC family P-type ATPase [uncultured Thiodictyon sp.]|uniref:HAD-IC family P-type ATPase n=1 Tax=uncultured Thiodictyon sp. TaxID=1846217 RepID=UPI0025CE099E|nr:HAD-IC family P-type ATPase [uncultured Thiodictyon sp.]